jgi:hypothetical protein
MQADFSAAMVNKLLWMARIRHYDRIVRLTRPNEFEAHEFDEVPHFRLFVMEFLERLGIFDSGTCFAKDAAVLYLYLFAKNAADSNLVNASDMTRREVVRYATCFEFVPLWLYKITGIQGLGLMPYFLDCCACLLVQFAIDFENGLVASE